MFTPKMSKFIATFLLLSILGFVVVEGTMIATRATGAKGILLCGKAPAVGVKVYLKKELSEKTEDIIGNAVTDKQGKFSVDGTFDRGEGEKPADPVLTFYHTCDKVDTKSFNVFSLRFPQSYITIGLFSRRQYDAGTLNLQIKYPGQSEAKIAPDY